MEARSFAALPRSYVIFLLVLALGAILTGCGRGEEGSESAPAKPQPAAAEESVEATAPEETEAAEAPARTATVRLSGTEGTIYAGSYGNLDGSEYAEGLLEGEPVEFTVDLRKSGFDVVNASFSKPGVEDDGTLKIEILSGGEVVAGQEAETQYGTLNLTWSSEG